MNETLLPQWDEDEKSDATVTERHIALGTHIESLRDYGPGKYTRNVNAAFADAFVYDDEFQILMHDYLSGPRGGGQLLRNVAMRNSKAFQAIHIDRYEEAHPGEIWTPKAFDSVAACHKAIKRIYRDSGLRDQYLHYISEPNAANPISRTAVYAAVLALVDIDGPVSVLDIACSTNNSVKNSALPKSERVNVPEIEVVDRRTPEDIDDNRTQALKDLMEQNCVELDYGLGIDILDWPNNPALLRKIRSDSFYLEELFNTEMVRKYDRLVAATPSNVDFRVMDAAIDYSDAKLLMEKGIENPDFDQAFNGVFTSTALYQMDRHGRKQTPINAERWAKDFVAVIDFVEIAPTDRMRFYPQSKWPGHYNVWIKFLKDPNAIYRKYLSFRSGRGQLATLHASLAKLDVAGDYGLLP